MKLSIIQQQYGGNNPISISEYFLNNDFVNSSQFIPVEGNKISFSHFVDDIYSVPQQHVACLTSNNGFNVNLNYIANWHTSNNINPIIDATFSNFYYYLYDGYGNVNAIYSINDGGRDMFDGGNYIDIWGNCITGFSNLSYGTINTERTHGFYITPVDVWPNTTVVYAQTGTSRITTHGDVGSDSSGTVFNSNVSYSTSNDRFGEIYYNANGLASDPSVLDVWFTIQNSNWGSYITSSNDQRKDDDYNDYSHFVEVAGSNYIFAKTLLSLSNGIMPSMSDVQDFISSYVYNMPITITSSNINIDNRLEYGFEVMND